MASLLRERIAPRIHVAAQQGYVGLDIGTRALKIALIERKGDGLSLASARAVSHDVPLVFDDPRQCVETIAESVDRAWEPAGRWLGKEAACVLPCSAMTILNLTVPEASPDELRAIIGGEFADETGIPPQRWSFTWWKDCQDAGHGEGTSLTAVGVPLDLSEQLLNVLLSRGLACRLMLSPPQVLARFTAPLPGAELNSNVAILDWGYESAVLTVARGGRPLFSRILRNCGLVRVIDVVADGLQINPADVPLLICSDDSLAAAPTDLGRQRGPLDELIDGALSRLRDELTRTMNHLQRGAKAALPQQMLLCGGGATLRGISTRLASWTRVPTSVWNGPCFGKGLGQLAPAPCLTASAAMLSAMRWNS